MIVLLAIICGVTALFDMANNGAAHAKWAPWGIGIALVLGMLGYA